LVLGIPSVALVGGYWWGVTMWRTFHGPDDANRGR
jgi:nitrate reductase NapE component